MKRIKITSTSADTKVLLTYPTVEPNKRYKLFVEKIFVPAMNSLIYDSTLFTVERRLTENANVDQAHKNLPDTLGEHRTFTAKNVRTVSQLMYQLNNFFWTLTRRVVQVGLPYNGNYHPNPIPNEFDQAGNPDWYSGVTDNNDVIANALQCVLRPDGKMGFYFSAEGSELFVLKFTAQGKEVFSFERDYMAVNADGRFDRGAEYSLVDGVPPLVTVSNCPLPAASDAYTHFLDHNLFATMHYRQEIVLATSLPLQNTIECDQNRSYYRHQLVSYRIPSTKPSLTYNNTTDRQLQETTRTMYVFDDSIRTHNSFVLTGTELQNFNIYLRTRNYKKKNGSFVQVEEPYPLKDGHYFTLQLAVLPIS
jgi:hypothetical protein